MIDSSEASQTLADIDDIAQRVRQSAIYNVASLIMILWGVLVFAGNIATWRWPWQGYHIWISVDVVGVLGTFAVSAFMFPRTGVRSFNIRMLVAYLLFLAFGYFCSRLGHFTPREEGTFWPIYFMLFYSIAGLWFGYAFIAIGVGITALTLVAYFYVGAAFPLWMAFINGGGLILGGLWMRRN